MTSPGRPTKLTPEIHTKIVNLLATGSTRGVAAGYAGIDPSTLYRWIERGAEEREGLYVDFRRDVLQAQSRPRVAAHACILKAIQNGDVRAAKYVLDRKPPKDLSEAKISAESAAVKYRRELLELLRDPVLAPLLLTKHNLSEEQWAALGKEVAAIARRI